MNEEKQTHALLAITCNGTFYHASFRVEDKEFICNICGKHFTSEIQKLRDSILESLGEREILDDLLEKLKYGKKYAEYPLGSADYWKQEGYNDALDDIRRQFIDFLYQFTKEE